MYFVRLLQLIVCVRAIFSGKQMLCVFCHKYLKINDLNLNNCNQMNIFGNCAKDQNAGDNDYG